MSIKKSNARRHHPLLWDPIYKYKKAVESELPKALYGQMIDAAIAGDEPVSYGRVTGIIPLSAVNTDGDFFMPRCWGKAPEPNYPTGAVEVKLAHPSILWDHGFTHHESFLKDISPAQHGVSPIVTALPAMEMSGKVQRLGFGRNPDGRNYGMGGTIDKEGHFNLTEISLISDPGKL